MTRIAIKVSGLSKAYTRKIGLANSIKKNATTLARNIKKTIQGKPLFSMSQNDAPDFFALKDISFEIKEGERVGVLGRNGAGKSTLLKVLSRITRPTAGNVDIHGRLSALLEVGTGFHPELTGRENIFLNAAILGLSRKEVKARFDEIVDFSGVEDFLDLPIKHYSSGMFMRLAFSVSAHLDPDILVLDEVLAVGDAAFQKKCLGKMTKVASDGRTIIFVSHSLPSIISFCDRSLMLENGRLVKDGKTPDVIEYYQKSIAEEGELSDELIKATKNLTKNAIFTNIKLTPYGQDGLAKEIFRVGNDLDITATLVASKKITDNNIAVVIYDDNNYRLVDVNIALKDDCLSLNNGEEATINFHLKNLLLKPGSYRISLWSGRRAIEDSDLINNAAKLNVEIDPYSIKHFYIFDGPYQCQFTHTISIKKSTIKVHAN